MTTTAFAPSAFPKADGGIINSPHPHLGRADGYPEAHTHL